MSSIDIEIDVNGVERVTRRLAEGVRAGAKQTRDDLLTTGQNKARSIIVSRDAVWRTHLYRSVKKIPTTSSAGHYTGQVRADTPYAATIEGGRRPGARAPPVGALIPWVKSKMYGGGMGFGSPSYPEGSIGQSTVQTTEFQDPLGEDVDFAGDADGAEIIQMAEFDTTDSEFIEEGTFSAIDDGFAGQQMVFYDPDTGEYYVGVVEAYNLDKEMQIFAPHSVNDALPNDRFFDSQNVEPVFIESKSSKLDSELKDQIEHIKQQRININESRDPDLESIFDDALGTVLSSSESRDYDEKLETGIGSLPEVRDTPVDGFDPEKDPTDYGAGSIPPGEKEDRIPNHLFINTDAQSGEEAKSTGIHELQHLIDLYGYEEERAVDRDAFPGKPDSKVGEHNTKSEFQPLEPLFFRFEEEDFGEADIEDYPDRLATDQGHAPAENYFIGADQEERKDLLNDIKEEELERVKGGTNSPPPDSEFEDLEGEDLSEAVMDAEPGDYFKVQFQAEEVTLRVESNAPGEDLVAADGTGEVFHVTESMYNELELRSEESPHPSEHFEGGFAEGDGPGREVSPFQNDDDQKVLQEASNRAWLRGALASENWSGADRFERDVRQRFFMNRRRYALAGSAMETNSILPQMVLMDVDRREGAASDLYQNHPDTFWAVNQVFDPTDEFKEDLEDIYNVPYEELVERTRP